MMVTYTFHSSLVEFSHQHLSQILHLLCVGEVVRHLNSVLRLLTFIFSSIWIFIEIMNNLMGLAAWEGGFTTLFYTTLLPFFVYGVVKRVVKKIH